MVRDDNTEKQDLDQSASFPQKNFVPDLRQSLERCVDRPPFNNTKASNNLTQPPRRIFVRNDGTKKQDNGRGRGKDRRRCRPEPPTVFDVIDNVDGKGTFSGGEAWTCAPQRVSGQQRPHPYNVCDSRLNQNRYHRHHRQHSQKQQGRHQVNLPTLHGPRDPLHIVRRTSVGNYCSMSKLLSQLGHVRRPRWFANATPREKVDYLIKANNEDYLDLGGKVYGPQVALIYNQNEQGNARNQWARIITYGLANVVKEISPFEPVFTVNSFAGNYDVTPEEAKTLQDEIGEKNGFSKFCPKSMPKTDGQGGRSLKFPATILAKVVENENDDDDDDAETMPYGHRPEAIRTGLPGNASVLVVNHLAPVPPKTARTTGDLGQTVLYEDAPPSVSMAPNFVPKVATLEMATIVAFPSCKFVVYNTNDSNQPRWKIARYATDDAFRSRNLDKGHNGVFGINATYALCDFFNANEDQFLRIKKAADCSAEELKRVAETDTEQFVQSDTIEVSRAKTCSSFKEKTDNGTDTPENIPATKALPFSYCKCMTSPPFTKGAVENLEQEVWRVMLTFDEICDKFLSKTSVYCFRCTVGPWEHNYNQEYTYGGSAALKVENDYYDNEEKNQARAANQQAFGISTSEAHALKNEEACGRCKAGNCQLVYVWHNNEVPSSYSPQSEFDAHFFSFEQKNAGVLKRQPHLSQDDFVRQAMAACTKSRACNVEFTLSDWSWLEHKTPVYEKICSVLGDDGQTNPIALAISKYFAGPKNDALLSAIISGPRRGKDDLLKCFEGNEHTAIVFCIYAVLCMLDGLILEEKSCHRNQRAEYGHGKELEKKMGQDMATKDTIKDVVQDPSPVSDDNMDWTSEDDVLVFPFKSDDIINNEEEVITDLETQLQDNYSFKDLVQIFYNDNYSFGVNSTKLITSICDGFKKMLAEEKLIANDADDFANNRQFILTNSVKRLCDIMELEKFSKSVIEKKCELPNMNRMFVYPRN